MKAVRIFAYGNEDVLVYGDYPEPMPNDNEIKVKVMATSVSGWDIKYRTGDIQKLFNTKGLPGRKNLPLPQQLGREAAGEVVAIGAHVTKFKVGDRVLALANPENPTCINTYRSLGNLSTNVDIPGHAVFGGNAQYIVRAEQHFLRLPEQIDYDTAAAGSWSFPTVRRIVKDRCQIGLGDVVFITGTRGGMGNAAVQWAKLSGARVIGATRSESTYQELKDFGVDLVINTNKMAEAKASVLDFTDGQGVDHFLEFTGNHRLQEFALDILRVGGTICPIGGDDDPKPLPYNVFDFVRLEMNVVGARSARIIDQISYLQALAHGQIFVPIAKILPLTEIKTAHKMVKNSEVLGKIILKPWD
jgi:NADPH:quinone reductase-like Zn-dependent oxidoreductase